MEFFEEVVDLLANKAAELFNLAPSTLGPDTRFKEDLGCKSIDIVKITVALENEYDVEVPFMAFMRCATFADAAAFIADALGIS